MPSDPSLINPFNEIRNIEAMMLRQRSTQTQVQQFTPTSAALYANYARDYPWMQPGVIRAASLAGYYPNNPDMVRVAATSLAEGVATGRVTGNQRQRAAYQNPGQANIVTSASDALPSRSNTPVGQEDPFAKYRNLGFIDDEGMIREPEDARPTYQGRDDDGKPIWKPSKPILYSQFKEFLRLVGDNNRGKPFEFMGADDTPKRFHPKTGNDEVLTRGSDIVSALPSSAIQQAGGVPVLGSLVDRVQSVVEPAYQATQPALRVAGAAANYPIQEIQQAGRNLRLAVKDVQEHGVGVLGQSRLPSQDQMKFGGEATDIGIMGEQLLETGQVDSGSGFFVSPTSQVARERVRREAEAGQIGGHNITWGRWAASAITEPNTVPFDVMSGFVDFSIQIADPTAAGLGEAGRAKQAAKLFEAEDILDPHVAAGILGSRGRRPFVDFNTAQKVFDSPRGARAVEDLTSTTSAYQIGKKLSQGHLDFKHDPALYDALSRTTQTSETRAILSDAISSGQVREVADLTKSWGHGIGSTLRARMPRSRLFDKMPGDGVHLQDPIETVNHTMRAFRNVDAPETAIEEAVNKLSTARTKSGRRNTLMEVFGSGPNSLLANHGVDPDVADQMLRIYGNTFNEMWRGIVDEIGTEVPTWEHVLANGEKTLIGGPHAIVELIEDWMPFPDSRALRELTSKFPNLTKKVPEEGIVRFAVDLPPAAVDYFMQEVWKPLALFRGAWLVRVLGEGQMRIAADGLESLFSHPLEAFGFMISKKKSVGPLKFIPGVHDLDPRVAKSFAGEPLDEIREYEAALSSIHNWAYRPGAGATTTQTTLIKKGQHADREYRHAWGRQLMKFNYDEVYSQWINSNSLDEMTEWLTRGKGRPHLREYQEAYPGNLETPEQVRKFLDDIDMRFEFLAKGNTDLFDILKSGKWTDDAGNTHSIYRSGSRSKGDPQINPQFTKHLQKYMDDGPDVVVQRGEAFMRGKSDYQSLKRYAVQNLLYGAMSKSENFLARGPVWRQAYAREMADMIQFGSEAARKKALAKAIEFRAPNRVIKHMNHLISTKKVGNLSFDEMNLVAKARAMDKSQKLLYNFSERRQIFDITRNFFPFGDAWYEVISTWGKLINNTAGKPLRRAQQVIEGSINSGFFHENRFGELSFTYPFSGILTEAITGQPVEMEGRVQGLSMFGEIIPGLGPVAQIPAAWFLKDKPDLKVLEETLLPYGAPEGFDIINPKTYMPGWMKNALSLAGLKSTDDKRLYENTVSQYVDYLMSTGEYGSTTAEQTRVWQDAKSRANKLYMIRVLGQFWLPAAPQLEFYVNDKSGTTLSAVALAEEFHNNDSEDFDTSVHNFVEKYGEEALGALVASSTTSVPGFPDSREGQAWVDSNPEIKGKYPLVYALFAPTGEFDIDVYSRQFDTEGRQALTAKQHTALLADWKNRYWRTEAMRRMGVTTYAEMNQAQRNAWDEISALIDEEYPSATTGIIEKPDSERMIRQLEEAGKDEDILATPAGPALTQYLDLRRQADEAVDALVASGRIDSNIKGFTKAKAVRPLREALRSEAQALIEQYPAFQPLWDHVFSRELIKE
jgi:hypothetical protein